MGQTASSARPRSSKSTVAIPPFLPEPPPGNPDDSAAEIDYSLSLPDECLACIFQSLSAGDRKRASVVCRRWLAVEGQSRHRLSLKAVAELSDAIPRLLRFRHEARAQMRPQIRQHRRRGAGDIMHCCKVLRAEEVVHQELSDVGSWHGGVGRGWPNLVKKCRGVTSEGAGEQGFSFREFGSCQA